MKKVLVGLLCIGFASCTKEILTHKLTTDASPMNSGTVSPPGNSFEHGQQISLTATPAGEYLFKEWKGSLSGNANPASLVMDADKQVTGIFEKRQYPLTLTIEGNGTVKEEVIAMASQAQYPSGTTVKLTARANPGAIFGEWKGDKSGTDSILTTIISKPTALTARFIDKLLVPAINTELFRDLNWNDHAAGKNSPYDFNGDQIPDIISYRRVTDKSVLPAIFEIKDYTGANIFSFDLKAFKPSVRDSLHHIMVDYQDLNNDGYYDFGLSYMGNGGRVNQALRGVRLNTLVITFTFCYPKVNFSMMWWKYWMNPINHCLSIFLCLIGTLMGNRMYFYRIITEETI